MKSNNDLVAAGCMSAATGRGARYLRIANTASFGSRANSWGTAHLTSGQYAGKATAFCLLSFAVCFLGECCWWRPRLPGARPPLRPGLRLGARGILRSDRQETKLYFQTNRSSRSHLHHIVAQPFINPRPHGARITRAVTGHVWRRAVIAVE